MSAFRDIPEHWRTPAAYRSERWIRLLAVSCRATKNGSPPRESSQYTTISTERLEVGSRIDATLFGYTTWEVVEVRSETRPLLGARDRFGKDVPVAGTLICRGVS